MSAVRAVGVERPTARLLTVDDIAERLGCSRRSAYRLLADGRIASVELELTPHAKRKPLRVHPDAFDAYLAQLRPA